MERKRGRRSKIAEYGTEELVDSMLAAGKPYREVARAFEEATGESISISSMKNRNGRLRAAIRRSRRVEAMVDELIEEVVAYDGEGSDPGEKAAAAARRMLMAQAVEAVSRMRSESFEELTPEKLAGMVNALERTRISAGRLRLRYEDGFAAAKMAILAEVRESLLDHPDVLAKVEEITAEAARALEERI